MEIFFVKLGEKISNFSQIWNLPSLKGVSLFGGIFRVNWEKVWKPSPILYREKAL